MEESCKLKEIPEAIAPPVCKKCHSDRAIVIRECPDSWTYFCTRCNRDLELDEFM